LKFIATICFCCLYHMCFTLSANAQASFERAETDAGILGLSLSNYGTIGKPDVRNNPEDGFSMRYPASTGTEHLFEAGIWLGGFIDGSQLQVSTASVTTPGGFNTGAAGFEFSADRLLRFEGEDTGIGVSEQDIIADFSDKRTVIETGNGNFTPINGHTQPLFADVHLESYNWGFPFTENFSILKYEITNNSQIHSGNPNGFAWDSVFVGMYADLVVRNVNTAQDQGGAFFNKNGLGYIDSVFTTYVFDAGSNDNPSINTYGALSLVGANYRDNFFHPSNADFLEQNGVSPPQVGPSYWLFGSGTEPFNRPIDDIDRFERMAELFPIDSTFGGEPIREVLRTDGQQSQGNYISFISIGPFPRVEPGETIVVYFAFSAALKPDEFQGLSGKPVDTPETRVNLTTSLQSLFSVFRGEDQNNNGRLDPGEDSDGDGELTRFLFPTPPNVPKVRVELDAGKATIFWDKSAESSVDQVSGEQDFEGYKVYRSDLGEDLNPQPRVIREFDNPDNDFGFNTGFEQVELDQPVTFEGDPTEYHYAFEIDGLLSGWQYVFSVTAFDRGSPTFNIGSLESSVNTNAVRVFPGTPVNENFGSDAEEFEVGVYPNPYRVNAAWDGLSENTRKLYFLNLPRKAEIRIYTLAGEIVAELNHNADTYNGDIAWFDEFSDNPRIMPGGEHAWDLQSEANQILTTGLYLYSVKDLDSGDVQTGKLAIIK